MWYHGTAEIRKALTAHQVQLSPALPMPAVTMSPSAISTQPQTQSRNADLFIEEGSLISKIHFDCGTSNKLILKILLVLSHLAEALFVTSCPCSLPHLCHWTLRPRALPSQFQSLQTLFSLLLPSPPALKTQLFQFRSSEMWEEKNRVKGCRM